MPLGQGRGGQGGPTVAATADPGWGAAEAAAQAAAAEAAVDAWVAPRPADPVVSVSALSAERRPLTRAACPACR